MSDIAKRRKIHYEWDGTREEVIQKVLKCDCLEQARERMAVIKAMRKDLCEDDLLVLELHMKLRYGRKEEALKYYNEVKKDIQGFLHKVFNYIIVEFSELGLDAVREFRDMIICYNHDEQIRLFTPLIHSADDKETKNGSDGQETKKDNACEVWMALLAIVTDAIRRPLTKEEAVPVVALQLRILEHLGKGAEPCRGLHHLGISMLKTQFVDLMPDQIFTSCDAIIKSSFKECFKSLETDSYENAKNCLMNASAFMSHTYRFFYEVMNKLGGRDIFPLNTDAKAFPRAVMPLLSAEWTPYHRIAVGYLLAILRLRLPLMDSEKIVVPVGQKFWIPPANRKSPKHKVAVDEGNFSEVLYILCDFAEKFIPLPKDVYSVLDCIGRSEMNRWIAIALFHTSRYEKGIEFCQQQWKESQDPQFLVIILASQIEQGKLADAMKTFIEAVKYCETSEFVSSCPELWSLDGQRTQKSVLSVKKESLGHWLLTISDRLFELYQESTKEDIGSVSVVSQILFSQLRFQEYGYLLLQRIEDEHRIKETLKCEEITDYIKLKAVLERLVILSNSVKCEFGEKWDPLALYTTTHYSVEDPEVIKLLFKFIINNEKILSK